MNKAEKNFNIMLHDILHFQNLRSRCLPGEYDYIMYTSMLDQRVTILEQYHREKESAKK